MVPNCQQLSWTHLPFIPLLYLWFFFLSHLQININWAGKINIAKNKLMICCGKESVKEICFTKLLQLILLPGGTSLTCTARAADQKHMINKRKTCKQIPISSFTSFNPCLTSGIAPHSKWLSPKFSSWNNNKKIYGATWSYFLDTNNKSHDTKPLLWALPLIYCVTCKKSLCPLCWTCFICKVERQLFFSLEISLLIQLTAWALVTTQRRGWDPSFWSGTGLAQLKAIVKLHPKGLERRLDTFYYINFWPTGSVQKWHSFFHNVKVCLD